MSDYIGDEAARMLRQEFDNFLAFNPRPEGIKTPEDRMAMARIAVLCADFRNRMGDIGQEANWQLADDIAGAHDDAAIPLYLRLIEHPDAEVTAWAKNFETKYLASLPAGAEEEADFVVQTCQSFYDPVGYTDEEDLEELLHDQEQENA